MDCRYGCRDALGDRSGRGNHGRLGRLLVEQRVAQRGWHRSTSGDRTIDDRDYSDHDDASHDRTTNDNAPDDKSPDDGTYHAGTAARGSARAG